MMMMMMMMKMKKSGLNKTAVFAIFDFPLGQGLEPR